MRKFNKSLLTVVLLLVSLSSFGASVVVKTMAVEPASDGSEYVRVVLKLTDKFLGKEIGVLFHEDAAAFAWNDGIGIMMIEHYNGGIQAHGYNQNTWVKDAGIKLIAAQDEVALWFKIDVDNDKHSCSAQISGESSVSTVYTDYLSRESNNANTAAAVKYCTITYNDLAAGGNTPGCVEVVSDATVVSSISPYSFPTALSEMASSESVKVYPSIVQDFVTISSELVVSNVRVLSLNGQQIISANETGRLDVSSLAQGIYLVEVKTADNNIFRQKIVKK